MKFSASKLELLEACPRFQADEYKDTSAADEGTLLHEAVETGDLGKLDEDQQELVNACLSFKSGLPQNIEQEIEKSFECKLGEHVLRGKADLVLYPTPKRAIVVDWKFGKKEVTGAKHNLQMQAYTLMVWESTEQEVVTVHLVCPRQQMVHTHEFVMQRDYAWIRTRIETVIQRAADPAVEATPSIEACQYCGAKATCTKMQALVLRQDYTPIPVPTQEDLALMAPATRAKLMDIIGLLDSWAKQTKQEQARFLREGGTIPGYTLTTRAGNPTVVNVPLALDALVTQFGLAKEDVLRELSMPLGAMANLVKAKTGAKDAAKKVRDAINAFVQVGEDISYPTKCRKTKE